jgi:uncharacterized protein
MLKTLGGALLALALLAAPAFAAPKFPALTGRVVDGANMLSPTVEANLTGRLAALESETGRQLVVVTVPDLQGYEIEDYGYQLGRQWGIGEAKADDGVLFIVAPNERKVRIEVGYGLEPILTDALSSVILQTAVIPKFKAGDMEGGVVAGADAVADQLALPADQAQARAQQASAGAGAHAAGGRGGPHISAVIVLIIIFFIFSALRGGRRGRRGGMGGILPGIILGSMLGGGRGGGGFGGGGSGFGGGGFGGGGGSFGGGGSSGGW